MGKYFGDWSSREDVHRDFSERQYDYDKHEYEYTAIPDFPIEDEILFACYTYENYSGSAMVLFKAGDRLMEVSGSHCSCNGLEGQWVFGEVTWDALALRNYGQRDEYGYRHSNSLPRDAEEALVALIAENQTPGVQA